MKEPISIKEIFAIVIKYAKTIICFMLVFAILAGGFQAVQQINEARKPENSAEGIEARYQEALVAYEMECAELQRMIAEKETDLTHQQYYINNSVLMKVNALHKPVSQIIASISNIDSVLLQQGSQQSGASAEYIVTKLIRYYETLWQSKDIVMELDNNPYKNLAELYLAELFSVSFSSEGMVTITATGENLEYAKALCDDVFASLNEMKRNVSSMTYPHELNLLSRTDRMTVDTSLEEGQNWRRSYEQELIATIDELNSQLAEIAIPQREEGYSTAMIVKETIIWVVLGAVVGVLFGCVVVWGKYIVSDCIEISNQAEAVLEAAYIGSVAGSGSVWNRLACRFVGEPIWYDAERAKNFVAEGVKTRLPEKSNVAVVSTLPLKDNDNIQVLVSALRDQGHNVTFVNDAERNPAAIIALRDNQYVLFAERSGKTTRKSLLATKKIAVQSNAKVLGFVFV